MHKTVTPSTNCVHKMFLK